MSEQEVTIEDYGHVKVRTPVGLVIISHYPKIGTGVSVYDADEDPVGIVHLKDSPGRDRDGGTGCRICDAGGSELDTSSHDCKFFR